MSAPSLLCFPPPLLFSSRHTLLRARCIHSTRPHTRRLDTRRRTPLSLFVVANRLQGEVAHGVGVHGGTASRRSGRHGPLGDVGDDRLGGEHHTGDGAGVHEPGPGHLLGVDDARLHHVDELAVHGVVAHLPLAVENLLDDDVALHAGVVGDQAAGRDESLLDNLRAELLLGVGERILELVNHEREVHQGGAAAGDDTLLDRGEGGVFGILDAELAVLELGLGGGANLDDGDAARELGDALGELLGVVDGV
mmetsp:Transcript_7509/g.33951  ORF Transcript_7509/g.33951 Transcript_7509/m.33951 type:complete len:251 (-) Transcript_7509:1255-2007(-)